MRGSHPVVLPPNSPVLVGGSAGAWLVPYLLVHSPRGSSLLRPPISHLFPRPSAPAKFNHSPVPKSPCLSHPWALAPVIFCPAFKAPSLPDHPRPLSLLPSLVLSALKAYPLYTAIILPNNFNFTFQNLSTEVPVSGGDWF